MERETNIYLLDDDIITKILLLLLPFESVLACKRVSKQWKHLINNPNFSNLYHHNGSLIVLLNANKLYCVLVRHKTNLPYTVHRIPIKFMDEIYCYQLVLLSGWSNGNIVCVKASNGYFLLYNLFAGVSHIVKDSPLQLHSRFWIYYGFVYDRYDDDHKIVLVCDYKARDWFDVDKVQNKENSLFWVYSSGNRSWESHDGFPYAECRWSYLSRGGRCYFFNGVLHSVVSKRKLGLWVIVTYDIHTRRFGEISIPEGADTKTRYVEGTITELDGRLLCYDFTNNEIKKVDATTTWLKQQTKQMRKRKR